MRDFPISVEIHAFLFFVFVCVCVCVWFQRGGEVRMSGKEIECSLSYLPLLFRDLHLPVCVIVCFHTY